LLYPIKGTILETKGDEAAAIETYKEYLEIINPIIDVMKSKKIYLGDNTDKVQSVLGKPKSSVSSLRQGSQDTAIVEIYDIDGKEAYLGFLKKFMESSNSLYSFKYDMPANWSDNEKANTEEFDLSPLTRLAFMYYNKENYDLALEYAQMFQSVQPNNSDINRFIIGTYQKAGKTNEALAKMKQLIQDSPQDYQTRTTYADLLAADGKYDEAIYQYKQALSVKSDFDFALHNLGSAYKNLAAELQKKENDKFDKDPSYTRDYTQVKEVLGQSAEAFEAALKTERFANNIDVLFELVNIFDIQDNKDKLKTYLTKIESLEKTIDDEAALYNYYLSLVKVYSGLKDAAKLEEVQKKLEAME
jgi:hypothetical protein